MAKIVTTNYFREKLAVQEVNLSANSFAVALMNNYVTTSTESTLKGISTWSQVSAYQVTGTGYSALPLSASTVSANVSNIVYWDGINLTWTSVSFTTYGCCIYRISDGLVVGFIEFNSSVSPLNGSFNLQWNAAGIMNIY